jgi:hypothetical protein
MNLRELQKHNVVGTNDDSRHIIKHIDDVLFGNNGNNYIKNMLQELT